MSLEEENVRLRVALGRIAKWHDEFPPSGHYWEDGRPMPYTIAFGSNGARDYMREVARKALEGEDDDRPESLRCT